jgi:hypothetical protein
MDACFGCGKRVASDAGHPVVAIMSKEDAGAEAVSEPNEYGFVQVPVCAECHRDPAHRTRLIKGHFFVRAQAAEGLQHAGSGQIGGQRG